MLWQRNRNMFSGLRVIIRRSRKLAILMASSSQALYIIFRVTPYSKNIARSLLKEPKIYFFDNGLVDNVGAKFENFVAVCLLKHVLAKIDYEAKNYSLNYL